MTTLAAISPAAARYFRQTFAGHGARSQRAIRKKSGMLLSDGLAIVNFQRVALHLKNIGYNGPLSSATDQTVCVKSLRVHNGCLAGAEGGDIPFTDALELEAKVNQVMAQKRLCSKVRAYTIQVPLPKVPTFVVAMLATHDNEKSDDIVVLHDTFLSLAREAGMNILSIGSDGAATELSAQKSLMGLAKHFLIFEKKESDIMIRVPLLGEPPHPVVAVQDPKRARKTAA